MTQERAKDALAVAVIGVGGFGRWTLAALGASQAVRVVGVSDRDPAIAQQAVRGTDIPHYGDNRSLLAETHPAAVYLAVPPPAAADLVELCAQRGVHLWKEMPLGRNLDEAVALVRLMEKAKLKFAVGTQRRFAVGYRRAWQLRRRLGPVFLGRAHYLFNWGSKLDWRGDRASAGGGALLELGYHPIDLLTWLLGLPEEVYGHNVRERRAESAGEAGGSPVPIYDTDDSAAAILQYRSGCMASVVTTRRSGPVSEELTLHSLNGSLTANSESCLLRDPDGTVLDQANDGGGPLGMFVRQAEAFAMAVRGNDKRYECSARENLLTQAAIEAIYLSGRTCQPESPSRLLHTAGLSEGDCLKWRPVEKDIDPDAPAEGEQAVNEK
jgi:UDP-N-acetyl-2-amino-2-deoxyglucuronate dehydrogenase